jgi:hypothetical protein
MFRASAPEPEVVEHRNRAMTVLGLGLIAVLSWMVLVNAWGDPRMVTVVLAVVVWCIGSWVALRALVRPTVLLDDDGVSVVNPLARHRVAWADVLSVTLANGPVRIHTRGGRPIAVWASVELAPIHGEHPHADRVAASLTNRLDGARLRLRAADPHPG